MTPEQAKKFVPKLAIWRQDPVRFVRECLGAEPEEWQLEGLEHFNASQRLLFKANKGPGKTTELAWMGWLFMLTRRHPKITAMSITGSNLKAGLWTELSKWYQKSPVLQAFFVVNKESIISREHPDTWWIQARTWSAQADSSQQADSLAGLHADNTLALCDEMGGYPDSVMAAIEATLAGPGDHKIVGAGNPTHLTGPLWRACTTERKYWYVVEITGDPDDPKRAKRVPIAWAREQIEKYGRDNPWVLVNVFGQFPPSSINSLIGPNDIQKVMGAHLHESEYSFAQKRLGVDVARFGSDRTVIFPRQGLACFMPVVMRGATTDEIAARVMTAKAGWESELEFVDGTGGFGAGVIDQLRLGGVDAIDVQFAGKASDQQFYNKRAEMYFLLAKAIKAGMVLPNLPELADELCAPTYTLFKGKLLIESKEQIKARLGYSPDVGDALATTFYWPDMPSKFGAQRKALSGVGRNMSEHEWDPFREGMQ